MTDGAYRQPGDAERICVPLDFVGINYYYRTVVRAGDADRDGSPVGRATPTSSR